MICSVLRCLKARQYLRPIAGRNRFEIHKNHQVALDDIHPLLYSSYFITHFPLILLLYGHLKRCIKIQIVSCAYYSHSLEQDGGLIVCESEKCDGRAALKLEGRGALKKTTQQRLKHDDDNNNSSDARLLKDWEFLIVLVIECTSVTDFKYRTKISLRLFALNTTTSNVKHSLNIVFLLYVSSCHTT